MKHFLRDWIVLLLHISGACFVYQHIMRKKGPLVRILAFHDVPDKQWFESIVTLLTTHYTVLTPKQFHQKQFDEKRINVLLAFDDGYASWVDVCLPVLQAHNIKGLFFVNSGLLSIAEDTEKVAQFMQGRLRISPKKPLTWDGAKRLVSAGHVIGGHTLSHPDLATLSKGEVFAEVSEDKRHLETKLEVSVTDFAYPFGTKKHIGSVAPGEVQKAGYIRQYSAITGFVVSQTHSVIALYPRTLLEKHQNVKAVKRWIEGGYDMFNLLNPHI